MKLSVDIISGLVAGAILCFTLAVAYAVHAKRGKLDTETPDDMVTATLNKKSRKLSMSGIKMSAKQYYGITIMSACVLFLYSLHASSNIILSILVAIAGLFIPKLAIQFFISKQNKMFSSNYQKALEIMSSSLKAGNSFGHAVKDVNNNLFIPTSVKRYFKQIEAELQMGVSVSEAFRHFADETGNYYVRQTADAIDIQNNIGNREDVVIKTISTNILDEIILNKRVNAAFASTNALVTVMDIFPPAVILFFTVTNRSYVDAFFSSPIMTIIFIILLLCPLIGSFIAHKMLGSVKKQI